MSCKKMICAAALCIGATTVTQSAFARERARSFEQSVYSLYQSLPVNTSAAEKTVKDINKQFPGWVVTTDKLNGAFTDIYGSPILLGGNSNRDKAQACISQKLRTSGIKAAEWKEVSNISAPKADYVNLTQEIDGHAVVYSWLSFRFTKDGSLARIQMNSYGSPAVNSKPSVTADHAKQIALQDLADVTITNVEISSNWSWYPVPSANGYTLHQAWQFTVDGSLSGSVPLNLSGYIDAVTGVVLERTNETKETGGYDLTVKGVVYKDGTKLPSSSEPLVNLEIKIDTTTYYTDASGQFSSSMISLPAITSVPLVGKWSTVIDSVTGTIPVFADTVLSPGTTFMYPTLAPSSGRHVNAYYHVNKVHDFMKSYFTTFTRLDTSLTTNVDITTGSCNAFYGRSKINFYKASSGCNSFAEIGDIIYHEYGHGISDHFYRFIKGSSMKNGSLNEANSDIWAMSITRNPILGENVYTTSGGFIRRYDMMPQVYPMDLETNTSLADVHKNGQIIAGAWWDLAINLGSIDSMTKLFTDVYYDAPDGAAGKEGTVFQTILIDALMADDDNSNLLDGTPHYKQIVAAFAKHGIYIGGEVKLAHTELVHQPPYAPIQVKAKLTQTTSAYFHDMTMYYRLNNTGTWQSVIMTDSIGFIPAQPMGTVVEYFFIVHDGMGNPTAFFPTTCNPALASNEMTLPYQFGVGISGTKGTDFETVEAGWKLGGNKGDDATGGIWRQAAPTKNANFNSFPAKDHTSGTGKCLVTGSGSSSYFGTGVSGGTSTVLSPLFAINSFSKPVLEYYRWFSNEQGFSNFKNDPWIVKVRNSGSAPWVTVENTYQSDNNWRRRIIRLSSFLPTGTYQVQLMFIAADSLMPTWSDEGQGTTVGCVDDVFIYDQANTLETPSLPAVRSEIYPNPADDRVQVVLQYGQPGSISVFDMLGKKVSETLIGQSSTSYTINTRNLTPGQYNLVIQTNNSIQSKTITVAHH